MPFDEPDGRERTEQPTGRRREEARRRGQVARSADLTAALLLLGALGVHSLGAGQFLAGSLEVFRRGLSPGPLSELTPDAAVELMVRSVATAVHLAWPLLVIPTVVAIGAHLAQTRLALSTEALAPQWSRIDPLAGFGRLVNGRSLVELLKSILKLAAVGSVAFLTLRADWPLLLTLGRGGGAATLVALGQVVWDLWLRIGLAFLLLGSLDYAYQWWQHEKRLRMTRDEVREETKQTEGDPLLRGRIRSLHRRMATRRMMTEVKRATVVLRNPTHLAVALRYAQSGMRAPKVVGKGERLVAQRIIEIARQHGIPVLENPPLARALFHLVAVGQEIPPALYRAVAEVLAYVYSLTGRRG